MVEKVDANSSEAESAGELRGVLVDAPADPWELARRVERLGDVAILTTGVGQSDASTSASRWSYVAASSVEISTAAVPPSPPSSASTWGGAPRWVGFVPYEHARVRERPSYTRPEERPDPHHVRPSWRRYGAVLAIDHRRGRVFAVGDDAARVAELARAAESPESLVRTATGALLDEGDLDAHADRIREALSWIAAGDLYQVNLARRISLSLEGDTLAGFERFARQFPASYGAALLFSGEAALASTSPELFLRATAEGRVLTSPIKGTRPRGIDADDDARLARELDADEKERAELTMIVDLERNDLGRVARTGTVRVLGDPRVVTHRTLHHRVADITAELLPGTTHGALLEATFPSGSVTGAPKIRAMELIAQLETHRRGLYTGAIGYVAHDGGLVLSIAIRTLTLKDGEARYFTGGGIVAGSDPRREVEETRTKALHLLRAFV